MSSSCETIGLYSGWRVNCAPTLYPHNKTPVSYDILEMGFFYACCIMAFSAIWVVVGSRGTNRCVMFLRVFAAIAITFAIIVSNIGQEWEVAHLVTHTQYKAGVRKGIEAEIGVKIGLRSVNITLKGHPEVQSFDHGRQNETINYNERFHWDNLGFVQGRAGFGPNAGLINREFRAAQRKGLPYPILWIAEYFTIDGEGIRWGRHYRQAGFYTHILLWLAFPTWLISMSLFYMVLRYGGYGSLFTGLFMLCGNVIYTLVRNTTELAIPFDEDKVLIFHWGWTFWLNLATGSLCVVIGGAVILFDMKCGATLAEFFDVNILQEYEEVYVDVMTIPGRPNKTMSPDSAKYQDITFEPGLLRVKGTATNGVGSDADTDQDYEDLESPLLTAPVLQYRKRAASASRMHRTLKRGPPPPPKPPKQNQNWAEKLPHPVPPKPTSPTRFAKAKKKLPPPPPPKIKISSADKPQIQFSDIRSNAAFVQSPTTPLESPLGLLSNRGGSSLRRGDAAIFAFWSQQEDERTTGAYDNSQQF